MTGFDRPNRSYYLEDLDVNETDKVQCHCTCDATNFTPKWLYQVYIFDDIKMLIDDLGNLVVPSARFKLFN